jgi:hypothetical protein
VWDHVVAFASGGYDDGFALMALRLTCWSLNSIIEDRIDRMKRAYLGMADKKLIDFWNRHDVKMSCLYGRLFALCGPSLPGLLALNVIGMEGDMKGSHLTIHQTPRMDRLCDDRFSMCSVKRNIQQQEGPSSSSSSSSSFCPSSDLNHVTQGGEISLSWCIMTSNELPQ